MTKENYIYQKWIIMASNILIKLELMKEGAIVLNGILLILMILLILRIKIEFIIIH